MFLTPEFNVPRDRQFSKGFKGKLEKFALKISSNADGIERPKLKKVGEFLFNLVRRRI